MSVGQKIKEARTRKGKRLIDVSQDLKSKGFNISVTSLSEYENNTLKNGPDPETLVRIASYFTDDTESILAAYLEEHPVYRAMIPKVFSDLNNIRTEPATIFRWVEEEAREAADAAKNLEKLFLNMDYRNGPDFDEFFKSNMEQIIDAKRAIEIAEFKLLAMAIMSRDCHNEIYERQQKKCEAHNHHVPEKANGTQG